jgi:hypothetical protein
MQYTSTPWQKLLKWFMHHRLTTQRLINSILGERIIMFSEYENIAGKTAVIYYKASLQFLEA